MFTYKSLKMIYFHAHVHIELKGARERIGKCKKMGKTLEINCDLPAQYQSISDHGLHRAKACTIHDEWLKNKNMFTMEQKQASLSM